MRVLITGAAGAIGGATARALAARGHSVVATARRPDDIDVGDRGDLISVDRLDVTDDESVGACIARAGDLDAIVNNGGITASGPLETFPIDDLRRVLETNTLGALRVIQAVTPRWRERGSGIIVNVSSVQGSLGSPLTGPYCASKWALEALSETLHLELGHFGIRTHIIQPGYISPGMKRQPTHPGPDAYAQLRDEWDDVDDAVTGDDGRTTPEASASVIADVIENPEAPLRTPIGADAERILSTRKQLADHEFEAVMRRAVGLTW